jgi:hypothetical protein
MTKIIAFLLLLSALLLAGGRTMLNKKLWS